MASSTRMLSGKQNTKWTAGSLTRLPFSWWIVAAMVAAFHMTPHWHARSQARSGWSFTGNYSVSPDMMQYRVWSRQSQETGVLVADKFTTEPNRPHLLVPFYYGTGAVSRLLDVPPEFVYEYAGSAFALAFAILLFTTTRLFLRSSYQAWWVSLAIMLGGGLGAHLNILSRYGVVRNNPVLRHTLVEGLWARPVFEDYRGSYVIGALFDSHYLLIWLVATASVVSLYHTLRKFSLGRGVLTAALYCGATLLHVYEGITLMVITAAVVYLLWRKKLSRRTSYVTFIICACTVTASLALHWLLYRSSGLPVPSWRASSILVSTLLLAYPVAWGLIAHGIGAYWREAGFKECFLLGWALGCSALTLSGPFYPYPDRGTMTLQIPLYLVAGGIYFSQHKRVTPLAALVALLLLGATPIRLVDNLWEHTSFDVNKPYMFAGPEHREMIDILRRRASGNDILIVDKSDEPWRTDDLWLAPEYPGRLYCGHFFLTVDYDRKCAELRDFYHSSTAEEQAAFLEDKGIRFVYVNAKADPRRFQSVAGLTLVHAASIGSMFEYSMGAADAG